MVTISEGVREVQNALTKDAVENKIKNWLRHCPRWDVKRTMNMEAEME